MFKHNIVFNNIKEKIIIGGWYEGMLIPSESQLCEMYDVSRITIRRALKELEYSGYVKRVQGKGTFVNANHRDLIEDDPSKELSDLISYKVIECKNIAANAEVARKLNIGEYQEVLYIKRLRYRDGVAEAYIDTWCSSINSNQLNNYDLEKQKILSIISNINSNLIDATTLTVSPIIPDDDICEIINVEKGSAHALLKRVSANTDGEPCEYTKAIINSDDLEFCINSWVKKDSYKGI